MADKSDEELVHLVKEKIDERLKERENNKDFYIYKKLPWLLGGHPLLVDTLPDDDINDQIDTAFECYKKRTRTSTEYLEQSKST